MPSPYQHDPGPHYPQHPAQHPGDTQPHEQGGAPSHRPQYGYTPDHPASWGGPHLKRPGTVWVASVSLWLVSAVVLVIGILALAYGGDSGTIDPNAPTSPADLGILLGRILTLIGAVAVASAIVLAALTLGAFRGINAARWTLVVLSVPALLALVVFAISVMGLAPSGASNLALIPVLVVALTGVILTLLLVPPTSAWFRYRSARAAHAKHPH